jgi:hypothetical protein
VVFALVMMMMMSTANAVHHAGGLVFMSKAASV